MPSLTLTFLGGLRITHTQQGEISLSNRKALALLAYLFVESETPHSRETILGLLWPHLPDADARNNLRVTWAQLTARLGQDDLGAPFVISNRLDLQFNVHSRAWRDVAEFAQLLSDCHAHATAHETRRTCAECQARLARMAELYRGEFLAGLSLNDCPAFDEWQMMQRERLHLQAIEALDDLAHFHEQAGDNASATRYARRQIELDPLRENAHRQLMRLLDKLGQRTAALEQFERCKRLLADELGVEPEPETLLLAARIRNSMAGPGESNRHNLPVPLTRFLGRAQEIAGLAQQLTDAHTRLITLTGSGGVGKTRLALRTAQEVLDVFADGVWLVELAALSDPQSIERAVASALGMREQAGVTMVQMLSNVVRDKQMLLIVDNCEHLLSVCVTLISQLLAAAPRLRVLTTSRSPLQIEGEVVYRVPSLAVPNSKYGAALSVESLMDYEAIQFFVQRAGASQKDFALNAANALAVQQICYRLDGIPLALELAAARLKVMPVETIAQRLDSRFKLLTSGNPAALPRQRTLQALVEWSYNLLSDPEQALLRRLAVFVGGWTLEAVEAICARDNESPLLDQLFNLVNHSLVMFGQDPQHKRYSLLESIRQYAHEQLLLAAKDVAASERHARYYVQLVSDAETQANTSAHQQALDQVESDYENILAALGWAIHHDVDLAFTLAIRLGGRLQFWELRGHFEEGRRWLAQLLEATQEKRSAACAKILLHAAWMERARPDYNKALAYAGRSAVLYTALGDACGELDAQLFYADIWSLCGETDKSHALALICLRQSEHLGYKPALARALYELGVCESQRQNTGLAQQYLERSIQLWREIGDKYQLAEPLNGLAAELDSQGEDDRALILYEELEAIHRELGYERGLALTQSNVGCLLLKQGDFERAKTLFVAGLIIRRKMGLLRGYVYSLLNFASLAEKQNLPQRAARLFGAAEALREKIGLSAESVYIDTYANEFAHIRAMLGDTRFNLEWARGRGLTAEQAVDIALQD